MTRRSRRHSAYSVVRLNGSSTTRRKRTHRDNPGTGGTGLVGPRLLKRFVEAGIECRALVRPGKKIPAGVTAVEGDILRADSLAAAVEGVSAIVHLAALFRTRRRLFVATLGRSARHGEGVDEATPVTDLDSPIMDRTDRRRRKRRARHTGSSRLSVVVTGVTRLSSWAREVGPAGLRTICCVSSGGRAV